MHEEDADLQTSRQPSAISRQQLGTSRQQSDTTLDLRDRHRYRNTGSKLLSA